MHLRRGRDRPKRLQRLLELQPNKVEELRVVGLGGPHGHLGVERRLRPKN